MDMGAGIESATGMKMSAEEKAMMQQLMPALQEMRKTGADPSTLVNPGAQPPATPPDDQQSP